MFERLKDLGKRDPERRAARKQRRADRAARRGERGSFDPDRDRAVLDAGARHYGGMSGGIDPGGGGSFGGGN
jgi:hypothetical protein